MKKLFSITLVMVLMFSLFAPVVHASESDLEKIISEVDKTNNQIDQMIYKAIEDAENEIIRYINDLETLEKGKEIIKLEKEITNLKEELDSLDIGKKDYQKKYEKILNDIDKKEEKISRIYQKQEDRANKILNDIEKLKLDLANYENGSKKNINIIGSINKLQADLDKTDRDIQKLNEKLNEKIDKIILDLINDTNKVAANMMEKAAKDGYEVICELVEVEVGGQNVWIDPLRVGSY